MTPADFPESNANFVPPDTLEESQCGRIRGYVGKIERGSVEGAPVVVTAWKPCPEEIRHLIEGGSVYLSILGGGLPPMMVSTSFKAAISPP